MKKIILILFYSALGLFFTNCTATTAVDDFFGIKMNPSEINYFRIVAYTESSGISYQSTANMDPNIFAWANIEGNYIRIKLVNNSAIPLTLNYDRDQYILINNENQEMLCLNGNIITYSNLSPVQPNNSIELLLEFPQDYWSTIGIKNTQSSNSNYTHDVWKGQNTIVVEKESIKYIKIILGFTTTIILKPVS